MKRLSKADCLYNVVGAHPISWRPWEIRLSSLEGGGFCQLPLELNCNSSLGLLPADCDLPTTNLFLFHTHNPTSILLVLFLEKPDYHTFPLLNFISTTKSSKFIMSFASIPADVPASASPRWMVEAHLLWVLHTYYVKTLSQCCKESSRGRTHISVRKSFCRPLRKTTEIKRCLSGYL